MPGPLGMLAINTGIGLGQNFLANRARKKQDKLAEEQAARNKLVQSFSPSAQPVGGEAVQPVGGMAEALSDPITKQLLAELAGKGVDALSNNNTLATGGMNDAARAAMQKSMKFGTPVGGRPMFGG